MALTGEYRFGLDDEILLHLAESEYGTGNGSQIAIHISGQRGRLFRFLLINGIQHDGSKPLLRNESWQAIGKAGNELVQACTFLSQSSFFPAPLQVHHAWLTQIKDMVSMDTCNRIGNTFVTLTEVQQLYAVRRYITQHLRDRLNSSWLAEMHGIPHGKLEKGFRHLFAQSLFRFIEQQRMLLAMQELSSAKTIKEITRICGYHNVSNFSTAFKRYTGYSPAAYRKLNA